MAVMAKESWKITRGTSFFKANAVATAPDKNVSLEKAFSFLNTMEIADIPANIQTAPSKIKSIRIKSDSSDAVIINMLAPKNRKNAETIKL